MAAWRRNWCRGLAVSGQQAPEVVHPSAPPCALEAGPLLPSAQPCGVAAAAHPRCFSPPRRCGGGVKAAAKPPPPALAVAVQGAGLAA